MSSEKQFAIYRADDQLEGGWEFNLPLDPETVRNLQRLGGRLTDGEAAIVLRRRGHQANMTDIGREAEDEHSINVIRSMGLWDPQAGEVTT